MDKVGGFNCKVTLLEPYKIALLKAFFFRNLYSFIKYFYSPTNAQVIVLKTILKFTLQ